MLLPGPNVIWLFLAPVCILVLPLLSCLLSLHGRTATTSRVVVLLLGYIIGVIGGAAFGYLSFRRLSLSRGANPLIQVTLFPLPGILLGGCLVPIVFTRMQTGPK